MIDEQDGLVGTIVKARARNKIIRWVLSILGSVAPIIIIVFLVVLIATGILSAFSAAGAFVSGLFGQEGLEEMDAHAAVLEGLTDEEILELIKTDKIDPSFYEIMMINQDEFQYLMERVIEYNSQDVTKTIQIECEHTYTVWVEDEPTYTGGISYAPGADLEPQGHYEKKTEYVYKPITVRSTDVEKFVLDWELVYALCLTSTMNGIDHWERLAGESSDEEGALVHYGPDHEEIDYIISNVQMNYEYVTDLARSPKTTYSMEECKELVHTTYEYGDETTSEGKWLYYYPHSVLARAYSGYSCMYYLINPEKTMMTNMITASDVKHFELIIDRFCNKYNFGYFSMILNFIPGGEDLAQRLELYYAHEEDGYEIRDLEINYEIGSAIDVSLLPTSTERLDTEFGDLTDYGDLIYDSSIGGSIIREAMSKVGCLYSKANRWDEGSYDCSSFIWRILQTVGIDLSSICSGSTAAEECRGMINAGMAIPLSDIQPGDIIFYSGYVNGRYRNITHVAFYAGNGQIVHAANSRDGVKVGNFYKSGLVCVCRPYKTQ